MDLFITFDPMSPSFSNEPYDIYRALRAQDAPYFSPELNMVMLSRVSDISQIALNPNMVRSLQGHRDAKELEEQRQASGFSNMPYHARFVQTNLLDSDGPEHMRLRRLVFGAFTGKQIKTLEADIHSYVDRILSNIPHGEAFDFIEHIASPLPGRVICRFLGVPTKDAEMLGNWSEKVVAYFDIDKTAEKKAEAEAAVKAFHDYLSDLKTQKRAIPQDDLISQMIAQEDAGHFQGDELISTCMLILMAGHGSTIDVMGTGLLTLLNHPDAMTELRQDPSLWPSAIEEMFRYEPPLPFFHRHAVKDVNIREHEYPAGTTFGLLYAAANRDESVIDQPDQFDIHRNPNRHMAFGRGAHLCLGNHLAKLNMRLLFRSLFDRFNEIERAGDPIFKRGLAARGLTKLHIRVR